LQQLDLSVFSVEVDTKADHPRYNVKQLVEMYGSYHIIITLKIGNFRFTVCELNIHDGYHSQKYNWNHEYQPNKTIGLHLDPMYCTAGFPPMIEPTTTAIPIQTKTMRLALVRVPNLRRFMEQQLFAFGNLLLDVPPKEKGYIALQRVVYLIRLTMEGLLHSAEDMKDMRVLLCEPAMLYTVISDTHLLIIKRITLLNKLMMDAYKTTFQEKYRHSLSFISTYLLVDLYFMPSEITDQIYGEIPSDHIKQMIQSLRESKNEINNDPSNIKEIVDSMSSKEPLEEVSNIQKSPESPKISETANICMIPTSTTMQALKVKSRITPHTPFTTVVHGKTRTRRRKQYSEFITV
jgi:hypothetical protein